MCSPRSCAAAVGALLFVTAACTDGVGIPLEFTGMYYEDGGSEGGAEDAATSLMDAAMPTTRPKDAGSMTPKPPSIPTQSVCDEIAEDWSHEAARDATKLLDALDLLRAEAVSVCGWPMALPPLRRNSKLECSARLRFDDGAPDTRGDFTPSVRRFDARNRDFDARLDRASFQEAELVFELLITNANSVESFLQSFPNYAGTVCSTAAFASVQLAGAARKDHVWVVDFGVPDPAAPGRPGWP